VLRKLTLDTIFIFKSNHFSSGDASAGEFFCGGQNLSHFMHLELLSSERSN